MFRERQWPALRGLCYPPENHQPRGPKQHHCLGSKTRQPRPVYLGNALVSPLTRTPLSHLPPPALPHVPRPPTPTYPLLAGAKSVAASGEHNSTHPFPSSPWANSFFIRHISPSRWKISSAAFQRVANQAAVQLSGKSQRPWQDPTLPRIS